MSDETILLEWMGFDEEGLAWIIAQWTIENVVEELILKERLGRLMARKIRLLQRIFPRNSFYYYSQQRNRFPGGSTVPLARSERNLLLFDRLPRFAASSLARRDLKRIWYNLILIFKFGVGFSLIGFVVIAFLRFFSN